MRRVAHAILVLAFALKKLAGKKGGRVMWKKAVLAMLAVGLALAPELLAQTASGSLTGKVMDEQGGVLPGTRVVAT